MLPYQEAGMVSENKRGLRGLPLCLAALVMVLSHLHGAALAQSPQNIEITSSPNPVGSGARALGMGGAFIAVADDATAASWNPGGLVQIERPEISAVGEGFHRKENNTFAEHSEASGTQTVSGAWLNYLSAVYPFTLFSRNMVVSLNYQHLYDFSREWNLNFSGEKLRQTYNYEADGGLYAWGIAYAVQIIPQLSFGITFNIWQDGIYQNGWEAVATTEASVNPFGNRWLEFETVQKDRYSFSGFNVNIGLLWNITDQLTLGAVFKSPFTADLEHEYTFQSIATDSLRPRKKFRTTDSRTMDEELDMPMSYGIGLAYRFSDRFTISGDIYRTEWDDFIHTDADGKRTSPITKGSVRDADIDPTTQVRLGAEYLFIKPNYTIPVRAGLFYDPAPAQGSPDDYYGFSLGTGIGIGRFVFDAAYVYRFGRDVAESTIPGIKFSQDVDEHSFYTSLIIHF
jgi:long-subunit fatty acid transport protein